METDENQRRDHHCIFPGVCELMTSAHDEPEYRTRRQRIDPLLRSQDWIITAFNGDRVLAEYDHHALT
jgi:hypothetical protein